MVDIKGQSSGCTDVEAALAADIAAIPERHYVNIHTGEFEAGAVRGQLRSEHEDVELVATVGAGSTPTCGERCCAGGSGPPASSR